MDAVNDKREKKDKKRKIGVKGIIIIILLIILLFVALIGWITDFMWFRELGYVSVFLTKPLMHGLLCCNATPVFPGCSELP